MKNYIIGFITGVIVTTISATFDRMIMFYLEDRINGDKEFYLLDELEKYLKGR